MSDQPPRIPGGVRRVGWKDRKQRLDPVRPLLPEDDAPAAPPAPSDSSAEEAPLTAASEAVLPAGVPDDVPDAPDDAPDALEIAGPPEPPADHAPFLPPAPAARRTHESERFPPTAPPPAPVRRRAAAPPRTARRQRYRGSWRHDVVAVLFLVATVALGVFYGWVWQNPYAPENPFALPTPYIFVTATPDAAAVRSALATERAENLAAALAQTPFPTVTPESTPEAPTSQSATTTPLQISGALPFAPDPAGVTYAANDNGLGCNWSSIAGRVFGLDGQPLDGYGVQINDLTNSAGVRSRVYSGAAQQFGAGGFELPLGGAPLEGQYSVQLFSQAGVPLSDLFTVITSSRCEQNVALVTFIQLRAF